MLSIMVRFNRARKTIVDKRILNVKTFEEAAEVRKEIDSRMFNVEKYRMNFCPERHVLGKTLSKGAQRRSAEGGPFGQSSLLEKGGDKVLVEFPENARAMAQKGYKVSFALFFSACPKLRLFYKHHH